MEGSEWNLKKSFVYLVWGLKHGNETAFPMGLYKSEKDAWNRFDELFSKEWKWLDVKRMELK